MAPQETKKAQAAKKAALKGTQKITKKVRTSASFHLPKTLKLNRQPKYPRRAVVKVSQFDEFKVIDYPLKTESAIKKIEDDNTLVFITHIKANKKQIKDAVKKLYDVDVAKVNTLVRPDGLKKAYVRLVPEVEAMEVASKIGLI
ncbi:putative 60S ribosomal protein L25 [Gorgonomyces haynaldii]|nr:putative 60S ribosomal protein L25 [Gorgonomyces haynaldii]